MNDLHEYRQSGLCTLPVNMQMFRRALGMTQMQVSLALHLSRQAVSNYECGRRLPDIYQLEKFAVLYHTTIRDLLYGPGPRPRET